MGALKEKLSSAVDVEPDCGIDVCGEDICVGCELRDGFHCQRCRAHEGTTMKETA